MDNGVCATATLKMDHMKTLKHQAYCKNCYFPTPDFKWFETTFRGILVVCHRTLPCWYHLLHFLPFFPFDLFYRCLQQPWKKDGVCNMSKRWGLCSERLTYRTVCIDKVEVLTRYLKWPWTGRLHFFLLRVISPSSNRIWLVQQWKPLQGPVYGMLSIWDPTIHRVT